MIGRESKKDNDLFFTCSLIEYISRKTRNRRADVVDALGRASIEKIYDLADVYHSDNLDTVCEDFIEKAGIREGTLDNVSAARYAVPSHWDIGKMRFWTGNSGKMYNIHGGSLIFFPPGTAPA